MQVARASGSAAALWLGALAPRAHRPHDIRSPRYLYSLYTTHAQPAHLDLHTEGVTIITLQKGSAIDKVNKTHKHCESSTISGKKRIELRSTSPKVQSYKVITNKCVKPDDSRKEESFHSDKKFDDDSQETSKLFGTRKIGRRKVFANFAMGAAVLEDSIPALHI